MFWAKTVSFCCWEIIIPLLNLDKDEKIQFQDVKKGIADYTFINNIGAIFITGFLVLIGVLAGIYGGWLAVEVSMVIIFLVVFVVIIFLLVAIF